MRGLREKYAVILDRHPLWLDAMDKLVAGVGIEVVGRATDGETAVELVEEHQPDVFIAGIDPSNTQEVACLRAAAQARPEMRSIVVADDTDPDLIATVFSAGASVYCVKTAEQDDLASAIRQAFERTIFIPANGGPAFSSPAPSTAETSARHGLTRREVEILRLVAEGHSNMRLARMLWVTEQTVKFHLSNIYRKLNVANRTEASRWAQLNGLLVERADSSAESATVAA